MEPITRVCKKCGEEKLLEEFSKDKKLTNGRSYRCKKCANEYTKKWRHGNKEHSNRIKERQAKYSKKYYTKNKKRILKKYKPFDSNNRLLLCDSYIIALLVYGIDIKSNDIKKSHKLIKLIELKKITIKCKRELKKTKQHEKEKRIALCNC